MDEALIRKVEEISRWIEGTLDNSKAIHELSAMSDDGNLYIAVSNGNTTGKTLYRPSEVSIEEFENLRNMQLVSDSESNTIFIQDSEGNILTSLNLNLLTRDFVKHTEQFLEPESQKQARINIDAVGNPEMEAIDIPDWSTHLQEQINF
ncbi:MULTISPECIES: hypothetical protein [unclassified Myroides]|uniref:hypothetical protein n=1 Tax=unclassified Myroides TaxID=2642485 RepID=UPI003D2F8FFD